MDNLSKEEKRQLVIDYVNKKKEELDKTEYPASEKAVNTVIKLYANSSDSYEEITKKIDGLIEQRWWKNKRNLNKEAKGLDKTGVKYLGITLNEQDIDLMMIANAKNINELQNALGKITNIKYKMPTFYNEEQFQSIRQEVYNLYMNSLTTKEEYFNNKSIDLQKKIGYLKNSGILDSNEWSTFEGIIKSDDGLAEKLKTIKDTFPEKYHLILQTMKDYSPIEKSGIIGTKMETYQRMYEEVNSKYNSITIDAAAKYGSVALADGSFDFSHLKKCLDFARDNHKQVRLNALIFYMDCPDYLFNQPLTDENKVKVKNALTNYVNQVTAFIKEYNANNKIIDTESSFIEDAIAKGLDPNDNEFRMMLSERTVNKDIVRSVDVFNELLNRFAMDGDTPYKYRGDIDPNLPVTDPDNIAAGWLKFLDVEDLCDVIAVARGNLPDTDFAYNDDNVVDPKKIKPTIDLIKKIQKRGEELGIKLIDSIGVQMHIDNSVTKKQLINMFKALKELGLPIEITEYDMAMTFKILGLSEEQINIIRIKKNNDFIDAIIECSEKNNENEGYIRGDTIWSKTDDQNFRVSLENERIIEKNKNKSVNEQKELVDTLHGGFYNSDMTEKKSDKRVEYQHFNYHTHTYMSGHSDYDITVEETLEAAKQSGIRMLGFSEHVPVTGLDFPDEDHRMMLSEVDGYIASINKIKNENPDMTVLAGFEAEFDPMKEAFLGEMREKVDYMILGQHFVTNSKGGIISQKGNPNYPLEYAEMVCKGIESGIFDIVAHPDIFMEYANTISEEDRTIFNNNCIGASHMICKAAAQMGIPIEINLGDSLSESDKPDRKLELPSPLFWEIAKVYVDSDEFNLKVLKGIDAHSLSSFDNLLIGQVKIEKIEQMVSKGMIKDNYDPVQARLENQKLQEAYAKHQLDALPLESQMVEQIVKGSLAKAGDDLDPESLARLIKYSLDEKKQECISGVVKKVAKTNKEISEEIDKDESLTEKQKEVKKARKGLVENETKHALEKQQKTLYKAKEYANKAVEMGCKSKEDFIKTITNMAQFDFKNNKMQSAELEQQGFEQTVNTL